MLLRHHQDQKPLDLFLQNFMCTGALLLLLLAFTGVGGAPSAGLVLSQLWWLLPFIFLIAMPGVYLSMWAVPLLAPGHRRRPLHDRNQRRRHKLGPVVGGAFRGAGDFGDSADHRGSRAGKCQGFVALCLHG